MYLRLFIFMWRYLGPCQRFIMEPLMLMAMNYFREKVLSWMFDRLVNIPLYSSSKVFSANFYLFKVNNRNTRKRCEICSKLTIKTPERRSSVLLLALNIFIFIFFVSVRWTVMKTCNERFNSSWKTSAIWQKRYSRKIFPIKEYEKALILKIYQCQNCIIFTYHIIMFLVMK